MSSLRSSCHKLAVVIALLAGDTFQVHAASFALGTIAAPLSLRLGNGSLHGAFGDTYTFSIASGASFSFDAFVSTGFVTRSFIADLDAGLYGTGGLLASGNPATLTLPEGIPARDVSFEELKLMAGDYELRVTGTGTSSFPDAMIPAAYHGNIDFLAASAPIPEPHVGTLLSLGLVALGVFSRRTRYR